jgi:hypothetical protein
MTGTTSVSIASGFAGAGAITSFTSTGFTLGTDVRVNRNGTAYCWYAFAQGAGMQVGSYTGNGATSRTITTSFDPSAVWVKGQNATRSGLVRTSTMAANEAYGLGDTGAVTGQITGFATNSFTVSNHANVNTSAVIYHWVAWRTTSGSWDNSSYLGDGTSSRTLVTECTPSWVFAVSSDGSFGRVRSNVQSATQMLGPIADNASTMIVAVGLFGGPNFIVNANANQSGVTYHWLVGCAVP